METPDSSISRRDAVLASAIFAGLGAITSWVAFAHFAGKEGIDWGSAADWVAAGATIVIGVMANRVARAAEERTRNEQSDRARRDRQHFERKINVLMFRAIRASGMQKVYLNGADSIESSYPSLERAIACAGAVSKMMSTVTWSADDFSLVGRESQRLMGNVELRVMAVGMAIGFLPDNVGQWMDRVRRLNDALTKLSVEAESLVGALKRELDAEKSADHAVPVPTP